MNVDNKPKLVNPIVSNIESENGKLKVSFLNSGSKELDAGGLVEINDSVTEGDGFDKHELKETEADGTVNILGSLYLGSKQITAIEASTSDNNNIITFSLIDQNGDASQLELTLPK